MVHAMGPGTVISPDRSHRSEQSHTQFHPDFGGLTQQGILACAGGGGTAAAAAGAAGAVRAAPRRQAAVVEGRMTSGDLAGTLSMFGWLGSLCL